MCEIPMEHTYVCALCASRCQEYYIFGDLCPDTSICPDCEKTFDKLKISWVPNNGHMVECKSI
jgi:hypothetical protein